MGGSIIGRSLRLLSCTPSVGSNCRISASLTERRIFILFAGTKPSPQTRRSFPRLCVRARKFQASTEVFDGAGHHYTPFRVS